MITERVRDLDPHMEQALEDLKDLVQQRYPPSTFEVAPGQDEPEALHLIATVDLEDLDEVMDLVIDRVLQLQVEEGLPVHVIPTHPLARTVKELHSRDVRRGLA